MVGTPDVFPPPRAPGNPSLPLPGAEGKPASPLLRPSAGASTTLPEPPGPAGPGRADPSTRASRRREAPASRRPAGVAENATRERLLDLVARTPGCVLACAARDAGVAYTTASYHVRILSARGLLVRRRAAGRIRLYPAGFSGPPADPRAGTGGAAGKSRRVLVAVARSPGLSQQDLARLLGMPRATVQWHAARLVRAGALVRRYAERGRAILFPANQS